MNRAIQCRTCPATRLMFPTEVAWDPQWMCNDCIRKSTPLPKVEKLTPLSLSKSQRRVCELLYLRNAEIGLEIGISERGVQKHTEAIFSKTGFNNRTMLALYLMRTGFEFDWSKMPKVKQ